MAGREELYLKHIDENTGRIAKVLEKVLAKIEHYESKDEHDDTVNILLNFASYYNDHAESELDRRKARGIWLAVQNYIQLIDEKEEPNDKNRT